LRARSARPSASEPGSGPRRGFAATGEGTESPRILVGADRREPQGAYRVRLADVVRREDQGASLRSRMTSAVARWMASNVLTGVTMCGLMVNVAAASRRIAASAGRYQRGVAIA